MSVLRDLSKTVISSSNFSVPSVDIQQSVIQKFNTPDLVLSSLSFSNDISLIDTDNSLTVENSAGDAQVTVQGNVNITGTMVVLTGAASPTVYLPDISGSTYRLIFEHGLLKSVEERLNFRCRINTTLTSPGSSLANYFKLPLVDPVNPLNPRSLYNFTVFWGDGSTSTITTWNDAQKEHFYTTPGVKDIVIQGQFVGFEINNQGDKLKWLEISNWGDFFRLGPYTNGQFYGCANLNVTASDSLDLGNITDPLRTRIMEYGFADCASLTSVFLTNTASLTQTDHMFENCVLLNTDYSDWNVQNVTIMTSMFSGCTSFKQNLSNWKPYACLDMSDMFLGVDLNSPNSNVNQDNYNALLISWGTSPNLQQVQSNVVFNGGNSKYSYTGAVLTARKNLRKKNWTLTDGGPVFTKPYFEFKVDTTKVGSASNRFNMPLFALGTYNMTVNWGDGSPLQVITSYTNNFHIYSSSGIYTVRVTGQCVGWNFMQVGGGDCQKLIQIMEWGPDFSFGTNMGGYLQGCRFLNISADTPPLLTGITNLSFMFNSCVFLSIAAVALWDVSQVTNMEGTFQLAVQFSNVGLNEWDVSNVTNMRRALSQNYINMPLNNWDVSSVTNMDQMFFEAQFFNQDIGSWDVSSVTNMNEMFHKAFYFHNGGFDTIKNWDVSSVQNMAYMFSQTYFNQPIGSWNLASCKNISYMFAFASQFSQPLNDWNTSVVENMAGVFKNTNYNQPIGTWNTGAVKFMNNMFDTNAQFDQDIGNWNTANVENMYQMFANAQAFNNGTNPNMNWNVEKVVNTGDMFYQAFNFNRYLGNWNPKKLVNCSGMFLSYSPYFADMKFNNGDDIDVVPGTKPLNWDTSELQLCSNMFRNCIYFNQSLTTSGNIWNMSKVTNLSEMFRGVNPTDKVHRFNNGYGASDNSHPLGWTFLAVPASTNYRLDCRLTNGNKPASLP
jgi:surface protein